ncbi:MAG TPA: flippase [Candidatus Limnocylindrales bacterium]|nr:flippase [Candidatus Limnocylindrales bacterium]
MTEPAKRKPARSGLFGLAKDFGGTLATTFVKMGLGILTGMITARTLGPASRGIFSIVTTFPHTLTTLTKFGQSQATIFFIRREKEDVARVASTAVFFGLAVGLALIPLVYLGRDWLLSGVLRGVPLWALLLVCPMLPTLLVESYLYGVLQSTDRFAVYNTRLFAESVLTLVGMTVVLYVLGLGLPGALAVAVTLRVVMVTWVLATVHRQTRLRPVFDPDLFRRMLRYGLKSHVQIIASHFNFKAGIYLCAYFLTPAEVAFYAIGARLAEQMMQVPQSLGLAMFPRLAGSSVERIHAMTAAACRQTIAITAVSAAALTLVGRFAIVTLYGAEYAPAAVPLVYISWGIVMMSVYVLLSRDFTARDRQIVNITAAYVALVGNVALNVWLIPDIGIRGAAIGTACSYSAAAILLYVFFLRETGMPWHEPLILRRGDLEMWYRLAREARARVAGKGRKAAASTRAPEVPPAA